MAQSLASALIHLIFSTKDHYPWLRNEIESELIRYLATICRECGCPALEVGTASDHVHIACSLSRTVTISKLVEEIKKSSSKWLKTKGEFYTTFSWQNGYGVFSSGQSQLEVLKRYIANQREHHRVKSFQEEFREFCARYGVALDERYVWD